MGRSVQFWIYLENRAHLQVLWSEQLGDRSWILSSEGRLWEEVVSLLVSAHV